MARLFDVKKGKKGSVKDFILTTFEDNRQLMSETYRDWMLNLAWVRGHQNVDFDKTTQQFIRTEEKHPWRQRLVTNLMLPVVRRNVAQLLYTRPIWDVIPATPDEEDIQIASLQSKVLIDQWVRSDMDLKLIRIAFWQSTCSSAFLKIGWDADKGKEIEVNTSDVEDNILQGYMEQMGMFEKPKNVTVNEGDVYVEPISPFNMTFEANAAVLEDSSWCIESQVRDLDWIVEKFGNKWKDLTESETQNLMLYPYVYNQNAGKLKPKGVVVHSFYTKKSKRFKKGIYAIMTGDGQFLKTPGDLPYEHGELPYSHYLEIYDPTSLWGTCASEQMRPSQARYNRISSGIMEHFNLMSRVQWLNPRQSNIRQFTNEPGRVYTYNAPYKPEQTTNKPIPAYVQRLQEQTRLDMQDITSTHDVSEAKAEPGVRSGRAVMALQDADDTIKGPVFLWFDNATARAGRLTLQTLTQYVTEKRYAEVRGEFNELEVLSYTGQDLKGQADQGDYWKVRVKTYGRQPMSRAAREATVRTLTELQVLDPQTHREELLEILGVADLLTIYDKNSSDRTRQWKEIQAIQEGNIDYAKVYFGQNHKVHIYTIKKYMASSYWEKTEEQAREMIVKHLQLHIQQEAIEMIYPQAFLQGVIGNEGASRPGGARQSGDRSRAGRQNNRGSSADPGVRRKQELGAS